VRLVSENADLTQILQRQRRDVSEVLDAKQRGKEVNIIDIVEYVLGLQRVTEHQTRERH
jgi:hypothetical protein